MLYFCIELEWLSYFAKWVLSTQAVEILLEINRNDTQRIQAVKNMFVTFIKLYIINEIKYKIESYSRSNIS